MDLASQNFRTSDKPYYEAAFKESVTNMFDASGQSQFYDNQMSIGENQQQRNTFLE